MRFEALEFAGSDSEQSLIGAVFQQRVRHEDSVLVGMGRNSTSAPVSPIRAAADGFFAMTGDLLPTIPGTEPTRDLFRDVAY